MATARGVFGRPGSNSLFSGATRCRRARRAVAGLVVVVARFLLAGSEGDVERQQHLDTAGHGLALAAGAGVARRGPTVAVVGPTGKLGRQVVKELVAQGASVRCLLRHKLPSGGEKALLVEEQSAENASASDVAAWLSTMEGVSLIEGDVTDKASLQKLLEGCSACLAVHGAGRFTKLSDFLPWVDETQDVTHAKQVNYEGVKNLMEAVKQSGSCRRLLRITGKGETPWAVPSILINGLASMAKAWNYEGEELLRNGDVEYTIIRPGKLVSALKGDAANSGAAPPLLALKDNGGDLKTTSITYRSVAQLCVAAIRTRTTANTTLCAMMSTPETPRGNTGKSWDALLERCMPDRRSFPKTLMHEHLKAVRIVGVGVSAAVLSIAAFIGGFLVSALMAGGGRS
eukprot:TRINITY_DN34852_c0_g1_i1.p1 TRINITY_DN34852_c0_g1~~TRINITY_DN34852_c0_g1_i1.p1  ORF type:complete len:401 (+),score=42.13 TRINITY_DN34852_c0_g1_i1:84-1286(+)